MFIYNVTSKVDAAACTAWLQWMQQVHIPEVMQTGCFTQYQLVHLVEADEEEGSTYAVQYYAVSRAQYNHYLTLYAPALRRQVQERWGTQVLSFATLMAVVN